MCPNTLLPSRYTEIVHRLALGVEPLDAARRRPVASGLSVVLDGAPAPLPPGPPAHGRCAAVAGLASLDAHPSGRFSILHRGGAEPPFAIRLVSCAGTFAPRRLEIPAPTLEEILGDDPPGAETRARRITMFPGPNYATGGLTGLRARVVRPSGDPVRWPRVAGAVDGEHVGRAQGDGNGEFLLVVGVVPDDFGDLVDPLTIELTVVARPAPPAVPDPPPSDPLWDLPLEQVPAPGDPDDVSTGVDPPAGFVPRPAGSVSVALPLGRVSSLPEISSSAAITFE